MSGRRIPVDLGPLSLHVLDDGGSCALLPSACIDDVLRLRSVMRGGADSPQDFAQEFAQDRGLAAHEGAQADRAGTNRTSGIAALDRGATATLDDSRVALLALDLSATLRYRPATTAGPSSAVRLALRPLVLRDAELGVEDSVGRLEFSLWVGDTDDAQWLVVQLPKLTVSLGERLRRSLRVRVFDALRTSRLLAEQVWPAEGDA